MMLRYYYVENKDRLYIYDSENGFYKSFDREGNTWVTPIVSFAQVSEADAKKIANGVNFEAERKAYLSLIGSL